MGALRKRSGDLRPSAEELVEAKADVAARAPMARWVQQLEADTRGRIAALEATLARLGQGIATERAIAARARGQFTARPRQGAGEVEATVATSQAVEKLMTEMARAAQEELAKLEQWLERVKWMWVLTLGDVDVTDGAGGGGPGARFTVTRDELERARHDAVGAAAALKAATAAAPDGPPLRLPVASVVVTPSAPSPRAAAPSPTEAHQVWAPSPAPTHAEAARPKRAAAVSCAASMAGYAAGVTTDYHTHGDAEPPVKRAREREQPQPGHVLPRAGGAGFVEPWGVAVQPSYAMLPPASRAAPAANIAPSKPGATAEGKGKGKASLVSASSAEADPPSLKREFHSTVWTEEEDALARHLVAKHGAGRWVDIAREMPNKRPKQIHARWRDYLRPGIVTGPWQGDELVRLAPLHAQMGNDWSSMSDLLEGRSANAIKNRVNAARRLVRKTGFGKSDETHLWKHLYDELEVEEKLNE